MRGSVGRVTPLLVLRAKPSETPSLGSCSDCAALRMALRDTGVSPGLPGENDSMSMRGGQLGFQGLAVPQDTAKLIGPSGFGLTRSPRRQSPTRGRTVGDGAGCQASVSGGPVVVGRGSADASPAWKLVGQARRPPDCRSWAEVTELRRRRGPGGPPAACGAWSGGSLQTSRGRAGLGIGHGKGSFSAWKAPCRGATSADPGHPPREGGRDSPATGTASTSPERGAAAPAFLGSISPRSARRPGAPRRLAPALPPAPREPSFPARHGCFLKLLRSA